MKLDYQSPEALAPVIEALIFASDEPLSAQELRALILGEEPPTIQLDLAAEATETPEETPEAVSELPEAATPQAPPKTRKRKSAIELPVIYKAIEELNENYLANGRTFRIVEIAGGYQFATKPDYAEYVVRLFKEKSRRRLSGAALETLAIIAYKQPVAKLDIENIRGVNCDEVLKSLLEKNLVTITGRAEAVGRPLLYGTTGDFLRHFGLPALGDLPKPRELDELMKEESIRATTLEEAAQEFVTPDEPHITVDEVVTEAQHHSHHMKNANESFAGIELDLEAMNNGVEVDEVSSNG